MHPFSRVAAHQRLQAAADGVERASSVELVIAVRPHSIALQHVDQRAGAICALGVLVFTLFAPPTFSLLALTLATVVAFLAGTTAMSLMPRLRSGLAGERLLREGVRRAARSSFVELGIHGTRGRTGVLVFVSLAEARIAVVADLGVSRAMGPDLVPLVASIEAAGDDGFDAAGVERLAAAIEALGEGVRSKLQRSPDDEDELPDELDVREVPR